ncbi:MAG: methyltransferase domain-containing protein [Verrucomicrobiales bacterium]|nr:methyltransferase domain-containing protein [Verrucomicrobiales bacterium]
MADNEWESRYRTGDTPWEKGEGSPGLADFLRDRPDLPRGSVLVPGCGTGHDARIWARHGFVPTGLDIAPSAIRLATERSTAEGLPGTFRAGDFLRDAPFARFDWIFEHTLFCAIQPADRSLYPEAVARWLRPGGHFLAVHYMLRSQEGGPPFGCTQEELIERFAPHFEWVGGWVPRSYPNRFGLELMLWWRSRST